LFRVPRGEGDAKIVPSTSATSGTGCWLCATDAIAIIQRVSGLSIGELDRTIQRLQQLRDFLLSEEERMRREMAEYLKLTQSAISSTKAMSEMIANFGSVTNS
jgi:hypothetical protein